MAINQLTKNPTEADLEARIDATLVKAFPWIPSGSLQHQTRFEFKFGRSVVTIDGTEVSRTQARLDILVKRDNDPLAVLELKRPERALTPDDEAQGLSYARMLNPRPPLVVVSNGAETKILATATGAEWKPATPSEEELKKLIAAAAQLADADMKRAVEVLLGPGSDVWTAAVRGATQTVLSDLTGEWADEDLPFIRNFLIPRQATIDALDALRKGKRMVIVDGPPLAGKSNVMRELAAAVTNSQEMAPLFVEADSSGAGLLQIIASILSDALGWQLTPDDARTWLRRHSRGQGPMLVLLVDGIGAVRNEVRRDIEELTGDGFGANLRIVISTDESVTPRLVRNETGRKVTRIGRRSEIVAVSTLDREEFGRAVDLLAQARIRIIHGGDSAPEFRVPWVLRALVANVVTAPKYQDQSLMAVLPPLLGPDVLLAARERFRDQDETRQMMRLLAQTMLADIDEGSRSVSTRLESMVAFVVRRRALKGFIDGSTLKEMSARGLVKTGFSTENEPIVIARLPELLASEISSVLANELADEIEEQGPQEAADWLVYRTSELSLGDMIGAQAILDYAEGSQNMPLLFIERLLTARPRRQPVRPGTRAAMHVPGVGTIDLTFRDDGTILAKAGHHQKVLSADEDDLPHEMYADMESWLILSHIAGHPFLAESPDGRVLGRADPAILLEVGSCPVILRRPVADQEMNAVLTHEDKKHGSIVCHDAGIVEPITFSIVKFLSSVGNHQTEEQQSEWIEEAIGRDSLPLASRIGIALRYIARGDTEHAKWAKEIFDQLVNPAIARLAFPSGFGCASASPACRR